jgi:creatinine amidohydrolase
VAFGVFAPGTALGEKQGNPGGLPVQYEELTVVEFVAAVAESKGTCIIPFGILEKHGPHLPLGTDLLDVREIALRAAKREYTIVFPEYYFGQIAEGKHQPGTIAYTHETTWNLLQETCDELARNGLKKIIIVNGHGGNKNFIRYFCQAQLETPRDYVVLFFTPADDPDVEARVKGLRKTEPGMGHAGETETSAMMSHLPELVQLSEASSQSGADQARLENLGSAYTAIWWYARFPNHYAGDGSPATAELGEVLIEGEVNQLVGMIRTVKEDRKALELQDRFFDEAEEPLKTKQ